MLNFSGAKRCEVLGKYIVERHATVREAAKQFQVSKSTVHKDVTLQLSHVNRGLWQEVAEVLEENKKERHLRGGEATKRKYREREGEGKRESLEC